MIETPRAERLRSDLIRLQQLHADSSILVVESEGELPERYGLTFHGRGLASVTNGEPEWRLRHACEMRLPFSYPQTPPDLVWRTPLFHPNVSCGGFLEWSVLEIEWDAATELEAVCERLWDLTRWAFVHEPTTANGAARRWFAESTAQRPFDSRPLRDAGHVASSNVVRYRRVGQQLELSTDHTRATR